MDWTVEFGGGPADVTVKTSGDATVLGFETLNRELATDPRFASGSTVLVDNSELDYSTLSTNDMERIARSANRLGEEIAGLFVAILAPAGLAYGRTRQFEAFASQAPQQFMTFTDRDDALEWLRGVKELRGDAPADGPDAGS